MITQCVMVAVCRAEMHLSTVSVRFGLLLEAYCRGCGQYMKDLSNQLNALNKMKHVTGVLQGVAKKKTEDVMKYLHDPSFTSAMQNISSPLDPSIRLKKLLYVLKSAAVVPFFIYIVCLFCLFVVCLLFRVDKCKVMDSKMRPLWIVFENEDANGDTVAEIFKNGDG